MRISAAPLTMSTHESCVFDPAGNVYIGIAGASSTPDERCPCASSAVTANCSTRFVLPTGPRGTDWIDLAGDHCTLFYTSEDTIVRRYNVCTHSALPDFAAGLTDPYCYALRLRPNREVMVACQEAVHRLSPEGVNLHTYTRQSLGETDPQGLFAMNLDPDGTSFWTAGALSGDVYHVDIESGTVLGSFNSGPGGVAGLAVYDELTRRGGVRRWLRSAGRRRTHLSEIRRARRMRTRILAGGARDAAIRSRMDVARSPRR